MLRTPADLEQKSCHQGEDGLIRTVYAVCAASWIFRHGTRFPGRQGDRSIMSDQKREKIILIDGHSILNRAFYGLPLL